ncbi:MAG TPA: Ig domain-containing protein [Candidatus Lumbricidophila sp.]|nr:Ig domain-containing protein [Candidatus Lumbricidophila sp.]
MSLESPYTNAPKRRFARMLLAGAAFVAITAGTLSGAAPANAALAPTVPDGPRTVLVITTKFADEAAATISTADAMGRVFTNTPMSANTYYQEVSGGRISLIGIKNPTGDVVPAPVTVTDDLKNGCQAGAIVDQGKAGAAAQGYDPTKYHHVIVFSSAGSPCQGGLANYSQTNGWVFVDPYSWTSVIVHEMAHNLGFAHSTQLKCYDANGQIIVLNTSGAQNANGIPDNCRATSSYGDPYDPMGSDRYWFSAPHLAAAGWLTASQQLSVTGSGTYTINALEDTTSPGLRTLRIPVNTPTAQAELWIEHRADVGKTFTAWGTNNVTTGISIRLASPGGMTYLLNAQGVETAQNSQLNVGQTFNYPGVASIKLLGIDTATNTAQVQITSLKTPSITTAKTLPDATATAAYSQQLAGVGGTAPYGWSIESGTIPSGLTLSADGLISGTPTTAGTYSFKVRLRDANALKDWRLFTITVKPAPVAFTTAKSLPAATAGAAYATTISATGGSGSYTWWISEGALPAGLSLTGATATSINVTGTPTTPGIYTFKLRANDGSQLAYRAFTIVVS